MRLPCAACATAWSKPARPAQAARTAVGFSPLVSSPVLFGWLRMREQDSGMTRDSCGFTVPCNPVAAFPFLRVARRSAQGLQTMKRSGRAGYGTAHSSFHICQYGNNAEDCPTTVFGGQHCIAHCKAQRWSTHRTRLSLGRGKVLVKGLMPIGVTIKVLLFLWFPASHQEPQSSPSCSTRH